MIPTINLGYLKGPKGVKNHLALGILPKSEITLIHIEHREELNKDRNSQFMRPEFIQELLEQFLEIGDITPQHPSQLSRS